MPRVFLRSPTSSTQSVVNAGIIEFVLKRITPISRTCSVSQFYPPAQGEGTPSAGNPLHKNMGHFIDSQKSILGNC